MTKILANRLFVQVTHKDILNKLFLITYFNINCEIYVKPEIVDSLDKGAFGKTAAALERRGIFRRIHAPIHNPYKSGFGIMKEAYLHGAKLCEIFGARDIVMHAEYDAEKAVSLDQWLRESMDVWEWIAASAQKNNITVLLENHTERSPEPITSILDHVKSPNLAACFDAGHFNVFSGPDISSLICRYPSGSIKEVHLSDNHGDSDSHLALGSGSIDFADVFESLEAGGIDPVYTIEAKDIWGVIGGFRHLKKIGRL